MTETFTTLPEDETCQTMGYQSVNVCVPVTIKPYATAGATTTKCCGRPIIQPGPCGCIPNGTRNGACTFTISQCICVSVPVNYGARAFVGDTYVRSCAASANDICCGCNSDLEEAE